MSHKGSYVRALVRQVGEHPELDTEIVLPESARDIPRADAPTPESPENKYSPMTSLNSLNVPRNSRPLFKLSREQSAPASSSSSKPDDLTPPTSPWSRRKSSPEREMRLYAQETAAYAKVKGRLSPIPSVCSTPVPHVRLPAIVAPLTLEPPEAVIFVARLPAYASSRVVKQKSRWSACVIL